MKTKYTLFRRNEIYYSQDSATGQQKSLHTRDETEALKLINARNEAQRQPVLNLHLARAYLTASDPAFVERDWRAADSGHGQRRATAENLLNQSFPQRQRGFSPLIRQIEIKTATRIPM